MAVTKGAKIKNQFKALAIECDGKNVGKLKEALYKLGNPDEAQHHWPITSHFVFVPLYESKA